MFSGTKIKKSSKLSWRDNSKSGGGALYEMASHAIDLVNFLLTKPDKVIGSILKPIYSSNVEDFVNSTFIYKNGITGLLEVNWSDKSYRKPTNKIEIFGNKGKLIADQHSIKIFLNKSSDMFKLNSGWNTIYITDLFNQCKFYVRGNEFTNQLYHFIENILDSKNKSLSNFNNASITHKVIEEIIFDHKNNNDEKIDEIIFGDNQFFGINHMSQEKAQNLSQKFYDINKIFDVYDIAYDVGIRSFMLNSNERAFQICDHFKKINQNIKILIGTLQYHILINTQILLVRKVLFKP